MSEAVKDQVVVRGGDAAALRHKLDERNISRVFLVTGRDSYLKSGAKLFMDTVLQGRTVEHFYSFSPNPSVQDLLCGLERFREFTPDCFIAVGGGSAIDMAKLISFFGKGHVLPAEYFNGTASPSGAGRLPLIAVPTTAGSGSEATGIAVIYQDGKKQAVESPALIPDIAVLNPEFTAALSPYQIACSGFDAFAQAIESYWAVHSTEVSRQYSARAVTLCLRHLESAVAEPSPEHRYGMMEAAYLAGKAIAEAKTTAAHALSYVLTAQYGLPHGHAVAMMFPSVFELNAAVTDENICDPRGTGYVHMIIRELCSLLNCSSPKDAIIKIRGLIRNIHLTSSWISEKNISRADLCAAVVRGVDRDRLGNNPRWLSESDLRRIAETL